MVDPWLDEFVNVPFSPAGDDLKTGINCWNLHRRIIHRKTGFLLPGYDDLHEDADDKHGIADSVNYAEQSGKWEPLEHPDPYCLVLIRVLGTPWHIATCIGEECGQWRMIHTRKGLTNSVIEVMDRWQNSILGYWQHNDVRKLLRTY